MDKATIEAMRAVVGGLDERARMAERLGHEMVHFQSAAMTTVEFRNAAETLRDLVDEAAERSEKQEKPMDSVGPMGLLRYVANGLDYASDSAKRNNEQVRIAGGKVSSAMRPEDATNAAQEIRTLVAVADCNSELRRHPVADSLEKAMSYSPHDRFIEVGRRSQFGDYTPMGQFTKGEVACFLVMATQASKAKAEAEQAESRVEPDERDVLTRFVESLDHAVAAAKEHAMGFVALEGGGHVDEWSLTKVSAVVRAINGMVNSEPKQPALATEPTLEECVAAMNRNAYRDATDWSITVESASLSLLVDASDAMLFGEGYIASEKAAEAKGGA